MNQLCKVCGEPAAGFHFGAFTCEGCKSFFGRTYNNLGQVSECKNGGQCVINKQNRTSCKACRLRKCLVVGMSKSGSRYGRRSNWFKIHCMLQEQQQAMHFTKGLEGGGGGGVGGGGGGGGMGPFPTGLVGSLSLSPASMPALSPSKSEDDNKVDSPLMSSPESCPSETSIDVDPRRTSSSPKDHGGDGEGGGRKGTSEALAAAGLSLYGLHPSLSLLHASHLYSRLYPPMLYPGLSLVPPPFARPQPPPSPSRDIITSSSSDPSSPLTSSSPPTPRPPLDYPVPPPPPFAPPSVAFRLGLSYHRKRVASPLQERRALSASPPRSSWEGAPAPEQDAPMDLSVKRPRLVPPPLHAPPATPVSPPVSPGLHHATPVPTSTHPVDLTTKA